MKETDHFRQVIKKYLVQRMAKDPLFVETYQKSGKNIDDCITYILNTVKASGCNGFEDEEIYGMAVHYYDEDDITVGSKVQATVIINQKVELTEEEIATAKQRAIDDVYKEQMEKMVKKPKPTVEKPENVIKDHNEPTTLF